MNIKQAKQEIINTVQAYLTKDETGEYAFLWNDSVRYF